MEKIQFQYPQALWLLAALPLFLGLYAGYLFWKRRAVRRLGKPALVKRLYKDYRPWLSTLNFILLLLAFTLGCVALANPRRPDAGDPTAKKGIDLIFALDVSNSMLAADVTPDRLSRAKEFIRQTLKRLPDNRVGLVLFAGQAYLQLPLTTDYTAVQLFISSASPAMIVAQGTTIGGALQKAELGFATSEDRYKSVILITDGETHDEQAVQEATALAAKGVIINTVGIGSPEGTTILDPETGTPKTDESGAIVISKLNEDLLKQLAAVTKGIYTPLQSTDAAVTALAASFTEADKKAIVDTALLNYELLYMWLVVPMVLLLLTALFLPDRKRTLA